MQGTACGHCPPPAAVVVVASKQAVPPVVLCPKLGVAEDLIRGGNVLEQCFIAAGAVGVAG